RNGCDVDTKRGQQPHARAGDLYRRVAEFYGAPREQAVRHGDAEAAGEVIVAGARATQGGIARTGDDLALRRRRTGRDRHDGLQHAGDVRRGNPMVAMTALRPDLDEAATGESFEVTVRHLRGFAGA